MRKNTKISAILGISLSTLQIVSTLFLCCMIFAYGLFFKGTPKADGNIFLTLFESIGFFTLLITAVVICFFGFLIAYGIKVFKTYNLSVLDYKNKNSLFRIYTIVNISTLIITSIIFFLLCLSGAFSSTLISIIAIYLGVCFVALFLQSYFLKLDIIANDKLVSTNSESNIKEGNFNQKYNLG